MDGEPARIISKTVEYSTPWFNIISKKLVGESLPYYSLQCADFVCVVALTEDDNVLLVEQYRSAVETVTLELPAGVVDKGEEPAATAARELLEETGFKAKDSILLGVLPVETGRYENKQWCFLMKVAAESEPRHIAESGIKVIKIPRTQIGNMVKQCKIQSALHVAAICIALATQGGDFFGEFGRASH